MAWRTSIQALNCFVIIIVTFVVMTSPATASKYTEQEDLSCNACEFAIKELDYWLRLAGRKGHYSLEAAVAKSLDAVCDKKHIEDEGIRTKTINCRELIEEHGLLIKEALVEHYESDEPGSYLKLIQEVCHGKLKLCSTGNKSAEDIINTMKINPATNKMEVSFSGTIKTVNPMKEGD